MTGRRLRIIGGEWRSRQIEFPNVDEIRPTPDRVRETLFNWLQGHIHGARGLEPFCGSGILSLEAASRGANHCLALDQSALAITAIKHNLAEWGIKSDRVQCEVQDARAWLNHYTGEPFDLVFLDPPFADGDITAILTKAASDEVLAEDGLVYVETPQALISQDLPSGLEIHRQKRAGAVHYCLLKKLPPKLT
jgi:16S rRNA (guanine966-N2)-methyltransferase